MLSLNSLIHSYDEGTKIEYPDWEVGKGEHSVILGNSGSGKTTLLHIIGGLLKPHSGSVTIQETDISTMNQSSLDRFRGSHIGIVFQKPHLVGSLTVFENLALSQYLGKGTVERQEVLKTMERLGIEELRTRKTHQISQGQAQRVAIGRALLNRPTLLLADEPTASLDDENCEKVIRLLMAQAEAYDCTLIVATHDQRVKSELKNTLAL